MSDPVSWLMIEPGWKVEASDGEEVGRVEEVTGDSNADIFDGLSIARGIAKGQQYVPAEHVGEIVDGCVRLTIDRAQIEGLVAFEEPPVQDRVSPEKASLAQRADTLVAPAVERPERVGLTRRVLEWLGRTGRR
ncbi:MAG: hypothetical protein ACRDM1_13130 [Gaiellaceae bacterium]